jgi:hypothetical protein
MIFWIGIVLSLSVAAAMAKKGLYETWTFLFNVVIAVYLGLTLGPVLGQLLGIEGRGSRAFVMLGAAVICLTVLYGISYVIFLSQFHVTFPKILDAAGGGLLGFAAGFLVWSFVTFLVSISPLGDSTILAKIGFNSESLRSNTNYMTWWTGIIEAVVSTQKKEIDLDQTVDALVKNAAKAARTAKTTAEPNEPKPAGPATVEEKTIKPADLGPPPELDSEDI